MKGQKVNHRKSIRLRTRGESPQEIEEKITAEKWMRWAYQGAHSSWFERILFRSSICSRLMGLWLSSPFSRIQIKKMIRRWQLDVSEFAKRPSKFKSFNDFFIRQLQPAARPFPDDIYSLVSPGDGRV
ncbi:MAG: hypothetical protein D6820_07965, partial [Lentisphaerae bacterium]